MTVPTDLFEIGTAFIEEQMLDTCMITRDSGGVYDDILDEDTLQLVRTSGDEDLIYTGKCLIKPVGAKDLSYDEGELPVFRKVYDVFLPKDSSEVRIGDDFKMTASLRDETLEDEEFRVMEVRFSTHSTYRYLRVEDINQDYNPTNPST